MRELKTFLKHCKGDTIIVTFVNSRYLPIFRIWLDYFERYKLPNLLVISLDHDIQNQLNNLNVPNILMTLPGFDDFVSTKKFDEGERTTLSQLWHLRNDVSRVILSRGFNMLSSDADAFWLKDIFEYNKAKSAHDIISSIAYGNPEDIVKKWGFVLCMGFFFVRCNKSTTAFWKEYSKFAKDKICQQRALCHFLHNKNVAWKGSGTDENEGFLESHNLSIKVVNDNIISRNERKGLYVYHPFLSGNMDEKLEVVSETLKRIGNQ